MGGIQMLAERAAAKPFWFRYSLATLFVVLAFELHNGLTPVLHQDLPFTFFITSSILAAYLGGFGAGMYALALGWFLGDYFFVPPVGKLGGYGKFETVIVVSDLGPSLLAIVLIEFLHAARRKARIEVEARKRAEDELMKAKQAVENSNAELEKRVAERTAELEQAVKFLEGFCYSIAHDLRAPLRAMQGFVAALEEDYGAHLDDAGKEYARRIVAASQRMDKLILDLLDYGRLSHAELRFHDVSLEECVASALSKLNDRIAAQKAEVEVRHPLLEVRGDSQLLELIMFHLADNALKFRRPNEPLRIEIGTEDRGETVRFFIRDNGIGIEPQYQDRIFRLFETLHPTAGETGAGLALVSKAIERMKGKVGVESRSRGGSTFWFELRKAVPHTKELEHRELLAH